MSSRVVLAAHVVKSIGAGQRYLVQRRWLADGTVQQRVNEGLPEATREWTTIGRWREIDAERRAILSQGWAVED